MVMRKAFLAYMVAFCVLGGSRCMHKTGRRAADHDQSVRPGGPNDVPARLFASDGRNSRSSVIVENVGRRRRHRTAPDRSRRPSLRLFPARTVHAGAEPDDLYKEAGLRFDPRISSASAVP